jgi:hypothetical protein
MFIRKHFLRQEAGDQGAGGGSGDAGKSMGNSSTGEPNTTNTYTDSGNQGGQDSGNQDQNSSDDFKVEDLPQAAQDLIKSLRTENADRRTKSNNLSTRLENIENGFKTMFGDDVDNKLTPEQRLEQVSGENQSLSYNNAVTNMAYENGIPHENFEYFSFLMEKAVNNLDEGQELSEEDLKLVIQQSKALVKAEAGESNSSVDGKQKEGQDPNSATGVTLDSFVSMGMVQKSELYRKSPDIYNSMIKQAREKRLL